jgi:hypothetical protein
MVGISLIALGALANVVAVFEFFRVRRGLLRGGDGAPSSLMGPAMALVVAAAGVVLAVLLMG